MKKYLLSLLLLLFSLFGCGGSGGGGADTTAQGGISTGTEGQINIPGGSGNVMVNFPAVSVTAQSLIDRSSLIRNGARLVVRKTELVEKQIPVMEEVCDWEGCWEVPTGEYTTVTVEEETFKRIADGALNGEGAGSVSINVPEGTSYTLEVLTYYSNPPGQSNQDLKLIFEYSAPEMFDIIIGQRVELSVTLESELAVLSLPDEVVAGTSYPVSFSNKSDALRDSWIVRQSLNNDDLSGFWFISDTNDPGVAGSGPITLYVEEYTGPETITLWHHGQFFISDNLIGSGEDYKDWTFGTSNAGDLNPLGVVSVVF